MPLIQAIKPILKNRNTKPSSSAPTSNLQSQLDCYHLMQLIILAECRSNHPLATGITKYCTKRATQIDKSMQRSPKWSSAKAQLLFPQEESLLFEIIAGLGIRMYTGSENGCASLTTTPSPPPPLEVLVGSDKLLDQHGVQIPPAARSYASSYRAGGKVALFVSVNGVLRAVLSVSDLVRPEAVYVVRELQRRHIDCYMITGDEEVTAHVRALCTIL